jgi:hypothetical protein
MRKINRLIIHCTATQPKWMQHSSARDKVAEIDGWHRDRGWAGFGYHDLIDRDGTRARGRPYDQQGAHVKGHNADSIGVVLVGGHGAAATDSFADHFTPQQAAQLRAYIREKQTQFPGIKISGHNEYANKGCPGFNVPRWLNNRPPQPSPFAALIAALQQFFKAIFGAKK